MSTTQTRQARTGARCASPLATWATLTALTASLGWPAASQAQPLDTPLPPDLAMALKASGVPASAVSLLVWPAEGGPARLNHETQAPRQAASVMKLFTTGVALQTLGPAYTWRTDVGLGGPLQADGTLLGPLYLRGSGDPSLVLENITLMLRRWRAAGLREVQGDLVLDRQAFALPPYDPGAFDGQALKPYNAGPDALLLNHQAVVLRLRPDSARPGWARASLEPELDGVALDAQVRLKNGACGDWRNALFLQMGPSGSTSPTAAPTKLPDSTVAVRGPYPASCGERDWPLLWQGSGPDDLAARLLGGLWREVGGVLHGQVRAGVWPEGTPIWSSWASEPLGQVVRDINKFSNNVMARQLFLTLGATAGQATDGRPAVATLAQSRQVVTQQVLTVTRDAQGQSPCADGALVMDNGSGLSRQERSSAACLGRWLQTLWASPVMPEVLASLPIAGVDGTARRLLSVAGRAHIKTGSLDGVAALAGVVDGDSGRRYVVVGIVNHPLAEAARPLLEALLAWAQHDGATPPALNAAGAPP